MSWKSSTTKCESRKQRLARKPSPEGAAWVIRGRARWRERGSATESKGEENQEERTGGESKWVVLMEQGLVSSMSLITNVKSPMFVMIDKRCDNVGFDIWVVGLDGLDVRPLGEWETCS